MKSVFVALLFVSSSAFAGATQVVVTCQSADKKVELQASFPGDMFGSEVVLKNQGSVAAYLDKAQVETAELNHEDLNARFPQGYKVASIAGVDHAEMQVLTVAVMLEDWQRLQLIAVPGSIKLRKTSGGQAGTFKGVLSTQDPSGSSKNVNAKVSCIYKYEI